MHMYRCMYNVCMYTIHEDDCVCLHIDRLHMCMCMFVCVCVYVCTYKIHEDNCVCVHTDL